MGRNTEGLQLSLLERAVIDPEFLVKILKKAIYHKRSFKT